MNTAVILTARKERDSDIPYPLIPFADGLCLLDRTLSILRDLRYEKILLVVGYKAALFEKYSSVDLKIIENKDYEFTASMGSLSLVRNDIKGDFLLIEGDTFYERKLLETLDSIVEGNCLSMTEESGSGDECFVETKNGFVTKITKDRHRISHFEGELIGVSRITLNTFNRLISAWDSASNPYLNYEYLLMDVTDPLDRPVIMFKNLIWGDVDCKADFKHLKYEIFPRLRRRENPYDLDNLMMHLQNIFPNEDICEAEIV